MRFYVKGFYPPFKNGQVIGCIHYVTENPCKAWKVCQKMRERSNTALFFVHDEYGHGMSTLITVRLDGEQE